jgi:hypothetical protein
MHGKVNNGSRVMPMLSAVCAIVLLVLLHKLDASHRYNVPIFWTLVTFFSVAEICRIQWRTAIFWIRFGSVFCCHILAMWMIFALWPSSAKFPLIFILPVVCVEIYFILKIMRDERKAL